MIHCQTIWRIILLLYRNANYSITTPCAFSYLPMYLQIWNTHSKQKECTKDTAKSLLLLPKTFPFQYHCLMTCKTTVSNSLIYLNRLKASFRCHLHCWEISEDDGGVFESELESKKIWYREVIHKSKQKHGTRDRHKPLACDCSCKVFGSAFKARKEETSEVYIDLLFFIIKDAINTSSQSSFHGIKHRHI